MVVDSSNNGTTETWGEDIFLNHHKDLCFSPGLFSLQGMHVHFVPIKVSVVRRTYCRVQPESLVRQNFNRVSHDTHFVQRRLPVKEHYISILQLALHYPSEFQLFGKVVFVYIGYLYAPAVRTQHVVCSRVDILSIAHKDFKPFDIPWRHYTRHCQDPCNGHGDSYFINAQVWVRRDHGTGREVYTLT